jgi:hypothetical protein
VDELVDLADHAARQPPHDRLVLPQPPSTASTRQNFVNAYSPRNHAEYQSSSFQVPFHANGWTTHVGRPDKVPEGEELLEFLYELDCFEMANGATAAIDHGKDHVVTAVCGVQVDNVVRAEDKFTTASHGVDVLSLPRH